MKKIYLSPSNHGKGQNKCRKLFCYEDKHTRPIADKAAYYLKASGFSVTLGKTTQNMASRVSYANKWGADLYIPIHTNATGNKNTRFLEFMTYNKSSKYKKLFDKISPYLEAIYPSKLQAKHTSRNDLYEITTPNMPTFYCEMGFHTSTIDSKSFIHNSDAIGKALAKGICKYYNIKFVDPKIKPKRPIVAKAILREGSKGSQVGYLQSNLNRLGAKLNIDKIFGNATEKSLMSYQKKYKLSVDGIYGKKSETKMNMLIK